MTRVLLAFSLVAAGTAHASVPQRLNYQGKLADAAGDPLSGTYSFRFKLFAAETGGAALFSEDVTGADARSVVNGIYSVQIGSYTAGGIPYGVFEGQDLYLEIDVNPGTTLTGAETLSPRERLNAAAWAVHALGAERLGAGAVIATFTSAGNLVIPFGVVATTASLGTLTASSSTVEVSLPAGAYPRLRLKDGNVVLPDYSGSSSVGDASLSDVVGQLKSNRGGSGTNATGGIIFQGFTAAGTNNWYPMHLVGTHGGTAPTAAAVTISGQKHSGTNNRAALTGTETVLDVETNYNGTVLMRVQGGGNVGISTGSPQNRLDVVGSAAFGSSAARSTFSATPGGAAFALQTASGVFVASGPLYLNGSGAHLRFPDGSTQVTAYVAGGETNTYASSKTFAGAVAVGVVGASNGTLVVQSTSATAGNPVVSARNAAGTELLRLQQDGLLGLGLSNPASLLDVQKAYTDTSGLRSHAQVMSFAQPGAASTSQLANLKAQAFAQGGANDMSGAQIEGAMNQAFSQMAGTVGNAYGSLNQAFNQNAGTVVTAAGAFGEVLNEAGGSVTNAHGLFAKVSNTGAGTVSNAIGLYVAGPVNSGGGSITNVNSVYLEGITKGTNRSALFYDYAAAPFRVAGDGAVGVGTDAPAARLHVSSANAGTSETVLLVSSGTGAGQQLLTVKGGGNVGIGTANPGYPLDVYRSGDAAIANLQGGGSAWNYSGFNLWSDEATDKYWALFHRKAGGEANNLLLEEFDGSAYKQRMVMKPDGTASFGNSTTKTQFELQGAGDAFNYTSFIFYNHDWTRYWAWLHRKGAGEVNSFYLEEFNGTGYNARIAFNPGGNVGLGTTDPVARLHVSSAGAVAANSLLLVSSGTSAGQELLVVKGDGKVGIGTASPGSPLHVRKDTDGTQTLLRLSNVSGGATSTNEISEMVFALGDGSTDFGGPAIWAGKEADYTSAANRDAFLAFGPFLNDSRSEAMRVTGAGNVGIGTASPGARLAVLADDAVNNSTVTVVSIGHTTSGTPAAGIGARLNFSVERSDGAQSVPGFIAALFTDVTAGSEDGDLVFGTIQNSAGSGTEKMRITSAGDIGIGTTSPGAKLGVTQADTTQMGIRVEMPTAAENTSPGIRVKGYSPAIELMDKDNVQNWYLGIDDNDSNKLLIGRGYGPGQGVTQAITIDTGDKVGIGTAGPGATLHVVASGAEPAYITTSGSDGTLSILSLYGSGGTDREFFFNNAGNAAADGTWGTGADYAEYFRSEDATLKPGELVCLAGNKRVARCATGGTLIGVVSTKPGILGVVADDVTDAIEAYEKDPRWVKVALMGQVPTRVSVKAGRIKAGMQLTLGKDGVAVAGSSPRTLLILALEDADKDGSILALIK